MFLFNSTPYPEESFCDPNSYPKWRMTISHSFEQKRMKKNAPTRLKHHNHPHFSITHTQTPKKEEKNTNRSKKHAKRGAQQIVKSTGI
mmetsp:Transcript_45820/g.53618  ORF Transcript_45820/g.53618 Transcript_45820/m.53618 type:complete len:88 (+) Transcript_45820:33-296(+)